MGGQVRLVHVTTLKDACGASRASVGRASLLTGVPAPFVYPTHARPAVYSLCAPERVVAVVVFAVTCSLCCLAGGYAPPLIITPCFLIVYAPTMRGIAYYANYWGGRERVSRGRREIVAGCGACPGSSPGVIERLNDTAP